MGMSLDTYFFWGVDLGDMTTAAPEYEHWTPAWMLPDGEDGDLDWDPTDYLAGKLGWEPTPFPSHAVLRGVPDRFGYVSERIDCEHPDYIAYRTSRDRQGELLKAADYGCEIGHYGSCEGDTLLYVAVSASLVSSDAWTCKRVTMFRTHEDDGDVWADKLTRYLNALDIPLDKIGLPGWHVTGFYG